MAHIVTFGEIMLRLSPPGREVLFQSPRLEAFFGGAEANVAVSLAVFGHRVRYVSAVPDNDLGEAAVREVRKWGVETNFVLRRGRRLGIYFAEGGANQKASKVVYDREGSGIGQAKPGDFDWAAVFEGAGWFHVTGVTPALSASAADLVLEALRAARRARLTISVDLNYRAKLWNYGKRAPEVMRGIADFADLLLGNEEDCQKALGFGAPVEARAGRPAAQDYDRLTENVMAEFPNLGRVALSIRESRSAEDNGWSAVMRNRREFIAGPSYDIRDIVDRIGAGDAFAAGLIHGLSTLSSDAEALDFAVAASCLKHSIPGDFNLAKESHVLALARGDRSGRIRR
jgi:2-dehydro-3-deoxygluconokinase